VSNDWLSRPHRTTLTSVVADGYNKIKFDVFELFPRFTPSFRTIDLVNVLQDLNRERIDFARGKRTGTEHLKARSAQVSQEVFAKDTASGIAGAQKQKFVRFVFHIACS
jgi:hypothetical protein